MRRGRIFFILAFVLILGLVAVLLVYTRVILPAQQRAEELAKATPTPTPVNIVIVSQNVPQGFELDETVLSVIPWQEAAIAPGMFRGEDLETLYKRQVKYDLQAGTPLLEPMLLKPGEGIPTSGSSWALNIPTGMVAVSIPMDRLAGISYAPRPGDHVNVIVSLLFVELDTDFQSMLPNLTSLVIAAGPPDPETKEQLPLTVEIAGGTVGKTTIDPVLGQAVYNYPSGPQRPRLVSQTLLQDVVVLQVGDFPLPEEEALAAAGPTPTPAAEEQAGEEAAPPPPPDIITLIVRPQDAVALNYVLMAQSQLAARLTLALRGPKDQSRENTLPVTLQFLLDQYQIPVPAKLPYGLHPRIDGLTPSVIPQTAPPQ